MDTQSRVEQFLTIEVTMQRLLDQLNQLREETESYSTAGQSLASATEHIDSLSGQLGSIASEVQNTAISLREIGTPEILESQDALKEQLASLARYVDDLKNQTSTTQEVSARQQSSTIEAISKVDSLIQELSQSINQVSSTVTDGTALLQRQHAEAHAELLQKTHVLQEQTNKLLDRVDESNSGLSKQIRTLQISLIVVAIVTVGIVSALIVLL